MKLDLGKWAHLAASGPFQWTGEPSFAGISGGRTSAMMAALLDPYVQLCFENTGREHIKTLEFLCRLEDALQRPITWLEWRPPAKKGAPPKEFGFAVVTYETCVKRVEGDPAAGGALFEGLLQALKDYRETKGLGPVVPYHSMRICTGYLKHKVQTAYMRSIGVFDDSVHDKYVGLRADEPVRVTRMSDQNTTARTYHMPLSDAGITKEDVGRFWAAQPFDLDIEHDRQGNCTACFLKDHADISRVLGEDETDASWWVDLQRRYPGFGGNNLPTYEQLLHERPTRLMIEHHLRAGTEPQDDGRLPPRRFQLVVRNERRYMAGEKAAFSCACESSVAMANEDNEDEEDAP